MIDKVKYFATLPVRRDRLIDPGGFHLLCLIDEETLRMGLLLIDKEREVAQLTQRLEDLEAQLAELRAKEN